MRSKDRSIYDMNRRPSTRFFFPLLLRGDLVFVTLLSEGFPLGCLFFAPAPFLRGGACGGCGGAYTVGVKPGTVAQAGRSGSVGVFCRVVPRVPAGVTRRPSGSTTRFLAPLRRVFHLEFQYLQAAVLHAQPYAAFSHQSEP